MINLTINFNSKEQMETAMAVMMDCIHHTNPMTPNELIKFEKDLINSIDGTFINLDESYSLTIMTFRDLIPTLFKRMANYDPDNSFTAFALYSDDHNAELVYEATFENNQLTLNSIIAYQNFAECSECGAFFLNYDEWDGNGTFICPDCGEEVSAEEAFGGCLPTFNKETFQIF